MTIRIPEFSLVLLIGTSGSGKSTLATRHFKATEVVSSDSCRALVSDDENDLTATNDAFDVLHYIVEKRLQRRMMTVVDATNVQAFARKPLLELARKYHCLPAAVILNLPEHVCRERNEARSDRNFSPHVIANQRRDLKRSFKTLRREGFRYIFEFKSEEEVNAVVIERTKLWTDRRDHTGPFDIIGDVHGCIDELRNLLDQLGYVEGGSDGHFRHPEGRRAVFLGDLMDRGPASLDVLRTVMAMVTTGSALCVPGNHDVKLLRKLKGRNVQIAHGLEKTLAELEALPDDERALFEKQVVQFLDGLISHYVLDGGKLVVAHAGMKEEMQGRASGRVRDFALYGETSGETDEFGLPIRFNWAAEYRGDAVVVYGHTPVPDPEWLNKTINIDTGCVFGGRLTALRYPEMELVSVPAGHVHARPVRPFQETVAGDRSLSAQQEHDVTLHIDDVQGKRVISTRLRPNINIRPENATAALEVMSRFAADPRWLIYLPPTMSPCETSGLPDYLEHPLEALAYYGQRGIPSVVCQEKHMGSRAVVVVCRDETAARERFGTEEGESGIIYTRTGRRFFDDHAVEAELMGIIREAMERSGFWEEHETTWACLDCELMPWSAKAHELLRDQYAPAGSAGRAALAEAVFVMEAATARISEIDDLKEKYAGRLEYIARYVAAYRRYCWPVGSVSDLRLAPFHLLATEGAAHVDKPHKWHVETLGRIVDAGGDLLFATDQRIVNTTDPQEIDAAVAWWEETTGKGSEGIVVKPVDFLARGKRELLQPAIKCRGREYLRIIYGPDYTHPENLARLKKRGLKGKRSLAIREFALGIEAMERFVRREPLRRVHECVFGILALESEPVDPRL